MFQQIAKGGSWSSQVLLQGLGCILAEDRKTVKSAFVGETGRLPVKL